MRAAMRLVGGLLGLALVMVFVAHASAATRAHASAATSAPIDWQPCSNAAGFQCAQLSVPLDYGDPAGSQISLALIRHPASDPAARVGTLFFNPGGPGEAPTSVLPLEFPFFSQQIQQRFDVVSFDPRGTGDSDQLQCFASPDQENALLSQLPAAGFPIDSDQVQQEIGVYGQFDQACAQHGGPIQYHMDTTDAARDMDSIRAALGETKLDYYGISYGSYLGAVYANLFPSRVGKIVLDGNVPPVQYNDAAAGATLNTFSRIESPFATETALRMMLDDCGEVDTTRCAFSAGSTSATRAKYRTLEQRLQATPVTVNGQTYTYSLLIATVGAALQTQNATALTPGWNALAQLLQALWSASASPSNTTHAPRVPPLAASNVLSPGLGDGPTASDQFSSELPEAPFGVLCSESPNPADPNSYQSQAEQANATQSPDGFGYQWAWEAEPCAQWQARDTDRYTGPWNRSPVPVLVIGTRGDANTPYSDSAKMAAELGDTRLLTETGGGHTALLNPSDCVNGYVDGYLTDGTLPPPATACDQNQPPF